jgi:hypothetical protein
VQLDADDARRTGSALGLDGAAGSPELGPQAHPVAPATVIERADPAEVVLDELPATAPELVDQGRLRLVELDPSGPHDQLPGAPLCAARLVDDVGDLGQVRHELGRRPVVAATEGAAHIDPAAPAEDDRGRREDRDRDAPASRGAPSSVPSRRPPLRHAHAE